MVFASLNAAIADAQQETAAMMALVTTMMTVPLLNLLKVGKQDVSNSDLALVHASGARYTFA